LSGRLVDGGLYEMAGWIEIDNLWKSFNGKTVLSSITLRVDEGERREIIYSIAENLSILSYLDQYPNVLNGGTRRKISIARALTLKPDILLLDEPFTGIDINTLDTLLNILWKLPEKFDITLLIDSHQFTELVQVVDRLYVLSGYPSRISRKIHIKDLSKEERLNEIIKAFQENID
jgi:NitT/TauT family transport system ATP-binding protein